VPGRSASSIGRALGSFALIALLAGCRRAHQVGDHVLVDWRGGDYPAVVVAIEGPSRFRVHYDGYSDDWDEVVPGTRLRGRIPPSTAPVPATATKVRSRPGPSASGAPSSSPAVGFRAGERVRVEWHGSIYLATILEVLGPDRYRVHYDGFGNEWDENVGLNRLQRK
jgi:hypothetical protein